MATTLRWSPSSSRACASSSSAKPNGSTGGAEGIHVPPPSIFGWPIATDGDFLVLIGILSALTVLLMTVLVRGPFGKNLQAAAGNEVAAEAFGVSVPSYLMAAFVVSSVAIAFAGALAAPRIRILDPDSFGVLQSIFMLAYPIVGGMYSIWGGLLGGGGLRSFQSSCGRLPIIRSCFLLPSSSSS